MKNLTSLLSGAVLLGNLACGGSFQQAEEAKVQSVQEVKVQCQYASPQEIYIVAECIAYAEQGNFCSRTPDNVLVALKIYSEEAVSRIPYVLKSMDLDGNGTITQEELDKAYLRIPLRVGFYNKIKLNKKII